MSAETALREALEAEWYNGNMTEGAYDRILAALAALAPAAAPAAREDPRPAGPWTGDPADYDGDEGR